MSANSHPDNSSEYVSAVAVDLLDELRITMIECRLVVKTLSDEADMNFDDLDRDLHAAQQAARLAYQAASVVHQGARLDPRWNSDWSRPRAIFARHSAAIHHGAPRVDPKLVLGDRLEHSLWQLPDVDRGPETRPTCTGIVRATKLACTTTAIYLGSGLFGAHCYSHATPMERDRYRAHRDFVSAQQSTSAVDLLERQRGIGKRIGKRWLKLRAKRQRWIDETNSAARVDQQAL